MESDAPGALPRRMGPDLCKGKMVFPSQPHPGWCSSLGEKRRCRDEGDGELKNSEVSSLLKMYQNEKCCVGYTDTSQVQNYILSFSTCLLNELFQFYQISNND